MKVTAMSEKEAIEFLGLRGKDIVRLCQEAVTKGETSFIPAGMSLGETLALKHVYGLNGVAAYLLMQGWKSVPWRSRENQPSPWDATVTRVRNWEEALEAGDSPTWNEALKIAGRGNPKRTLHRVWEEAGEIGFQVGSHHAKTLAAATCGEMAQISLEFEPHFFLGAMIWIRNGYWVCGWDEINNRFKVF